MDALSDGENPGRRNAAVEALVRRGDAVVDALADSEGGSSDAEPDALTACGATTCPIGFNCTDEICEDDAA